MGNESGDLSRQKGDVESMWAGNLARRIVDMEPGQHECFIYESELEHQLVLTSFIGYGLELGQKVIYVADSHSARTIANYLWDDGIKVEEFLSSGQFLLLTSDAAYLTGGVFDPERMIFSLGVQTEKAVAEGYTALRATGEMSWVLRGGRIEDLLIDYETMLNDFLAGSNCMALCQYDRRKFDPKMLQTIRAIHAENPEPPI